MVNGTQRRGSVLGPLVLIAIGLIFLLRHHIPGFDAYQFIARYWPALLIVWGLVRLAEHYSSAPGYARGGLSGGEVVLLVLVVIVGLSLTASWHLRNSEWGRQMGIEVWDPFARDYYFTAHAQAALPASMSVLVESGRGDVELTPGGAGRIAAVTRDVVRGNSDNEARRRFENSQPLLRVENGQMVVRPAGENPDTRVAADLQLTLPANTAVTVRTDHGDVRVSGWRASLDLATSRGDLTASNIAASLRAHVEHGDVTVQNVRGSLQLDGNGGDVTLAQVRGAVTITGDFSGEIDLSGLPAGLQYASSRTQLDVAALPGTLTMDMGDLRAVSAHDLQVRTRDKDIAVERFDGGLRIVDARGAISAGSSAAPRHAISISNRDGDITLRLPGGSAFQIDAIADQGSVTGDFGFPVAMRGGSAQAQAQVGGAGPAITLRTSDGTIAVRKLAARASNGAF